MYSWLDLNLIEPAVPVMARRGVSEVARGRSGFLTAYRKAMGDPGRLDYAPSGELWETRRENFVKRHMAQVKLRGEPLWKGGEPTRRHLALAAWAFSPHPLRWRQWVEQLPRNERLPTRRGATDEDLQRAVEIYEGAGVTTREAAARGGVPYNTLRHYMQQRGLARKKHETAQLKSGRQPIMRLVEAADPVDAYWLGVVWADGSVSDRMITLEVSALDAEHLEAFAARYELSVHRRRRDGRGEFVYAAATAVTPAREFARRYGRLKPDRRVPDLDDLRLSAFIRGVLDGDGSIGRPGRITPAVSLCGHPEALRAMVAVVVSRLGVRSPALSPQSGLLYARWGSAEDVGALGAWMLQASGPRLSRKWDLWVQWAEARRRGEAGYTWTRLGAVERLGIPGDEEEQGTDPSDPLTFNPALIVSPDTAAFRRWFGRSKVVDARGRPLVVFHGTDTPFDTFDLGQAGRRTVAGSWGGPAAYFTSSYRLARSYATHERVLAVYLSLQNPLDVDADGRDWRALFPEVLNEARAGGHDGLIIRRFRDPARSWDTNELATTYVAFDAAQVKSATRNSGAFDPRESSIERNTVGGSRAATLHALAENLEQHPRLRRTFSDWLTELLETSDWELEDEDYEDYLGDWLDQEHSISVRPDGLIEFWDKTRDAERIIGDLPVVVYHHTATGALPGIRKRGLLSWRDAGLPKSANPYRNSGSGVYVTTESSGRVVYGYHWNARQSHGGDDVTLTIRTTLGGLEPDPDDEDISSGAQQFILDYVAPGDIIEGLDAGAVVERLGTPAVDRQALGRAIGIAEDLAEALGAWDGRGRPPLPPGVGRHLGRGYTRTVYEVGPFAVKVALDDEQPNANRMEEEAWDNAPPRLRKYLLPVLSADQDGRWLIMPLAEPAPPLDAERLCDEIKSIFPYYGETISDCQHAPNVGRYQGRLYVLDYADDLSNLDEEDEEEGVERMRERPKAPPPKKRGGGRKLTAEEQHRVDLGTLEEYVREDGTEATDIPGQIEMIAWDTGYQGEPLGSWLVRLGDRYGVDATTEHASGREAGGRAHKVERLKAVQLGTSKAPRTTGRRGAAR